MSNLRLFYVSSLILQHEEVAVRLIVKLIWRCGLKVPPSHCSVWNEPSGK
jgi:hypothetical protein